MVIQDQDLTNTEMVIPRQGSHKHRDNIQDQDLTNTEMVIPRQRISQTQEMVIQDQDPTHPRAGDRI